jgi:hypothetical protein
MYRCVMPWERAARQPLSQVFPLDQFHDQRSDAVNVFQSINRCDVRVIEAGEHFGFALKALEAIGIPGHGFRKDFDRDLPLQLRVVRAIHLAHSACAENRKNFVGPEPAIGGERQGFAVSICPPPVSQREMSPSTGISGAWDTRTPASNAIRPPSRGSELVSRGSMSLSLSEGEGG